MVLSGRNHHQVETLVERAQDQIADLSLAAFEHPMLTAIIHNEPNEIAEAIERHLADLAGKLLKVLLSGPERRSIAA